MPESEVGGLHGREMRCCEEDGCTIMQFELSLVGPTLMVARTWPSRPAFGCSDVGFVERKAITDPGIPISFLVVRRC